MPAWRSLLLLPWCAPCVRPAEWECWAVRQCPPTCCKQLSAILKRWIRRPTGSTSSQGPPEPSTSTYASRKKVPVVVFFWDDPPDDWLSRLRAAGSHIWFQVGSVAE